MYRCLDVGGLYIDEAKGEYGKYVFDENDISRIIANKCKTYLINTIFIIIESA